MVPDLRLVEPVAESDATMSIGGREVVVADPAMQWHYELLRRLAQGELPVLICGETGSGKEIAATALHEWGPRCKQPLIALNCAALPEPLAEGELFGYERGAFSGAVSSKQGVLEAAHLSTVFLDEVGELPWAVQAKLLRVLETGQVQRLGSLRAHYVDLRIIAATNRDLDAEVRAGRFRRDLFYRLSGATVMLPHLRDRSGELLFLARSFLAHACSRAGRPQMTLSALAVHKLLSYPWPGNVRELRNVMEYAATTTTDAVLVPWHLPERISGMAAAAGPAGPQAKVPVPVFRPLEEEVRELERQRMEDALRAAGGVQHRAAALLSVPVRTFNAKVKLYGLLHLTCRTAASSGGQS